MNQINLWLELASSKAELFFNVYLRQKYFLAFLGSIFLLGILAKITSMIIYDRLINKSENMLSTKNKTLQQIKIKYENSKAVNGAMANPSLMVERYINHYKFGGISLRSLNGITEICGLICLTSGAFAGLYTYSMSRMWFRAVFYMATGLIATYWLDLFGRAGHITEKHNEVVCIITDFLENKLDIKDKRVERAGKLSEELSKEGPVDNINKLVYNPEPEVAHLDLQEWEENQKKKERRQEIIIQEVLAEFL